MTTRYKVLGIATLAVFALLLTAVRCGPSVSHTASNGPYTVTYSQKDSQRRSRTLVEYSFEGTIATTSGTDTGVKAIVSSANPATVVVDSYLMFPGATPNSAVASIDTFTIRQDRTVPFDPHDLQWILTPLAIPPDPGPANDFTIAGIDSDFDGIRDDVQRLVELRNPEADSSQRQALRTLAAALGRALDPSILSASSAVVATNEALRSARDCLRSSYGSGGTGGYSEAESIRADSIDTIERLKASLLFRDAVSAIEGDRFPVDFTSVTSVCP